MIESSPSHNDAYPAPGKDLFIYYIQGHLVSEADLSHPDFIGNWEEEDTSFLFFTQPRPELIADLLKAQPHLTLIDDYHMTYDEWQGEAFSAFSVGRFFIVPPWEPLQTDRNEDVIRMDPGLVFGNGMHPTTKDCLEALELIFAKKRIESVIDMGTGTGILALAAVSLGCPKVLAMDINHLAAKTAQRNVRLNGWENHILVSRGSAETFIDLPSEMVVANIHYDIMKELIVRDGFYKKKWFVLSGILRSEARHISEMLADRPVRILKKWNHDDTWHTFCGEID